jgi:ABC-type multidrug transport system ATPase subunit
MDCLALRKNTGEISGEVRLNGHLQDEKSFRRCTGYVEQFDTQTPQLTIKETMMFSAKLRLDESDPAVNDETIEKFVNQTMHMLELTNQQDLQVGSDATGGLSFEQKKRLSIAVELVANPSIIFLDEPTSGLVRCVGFRSIVHPCRHSQIGLQDARAASVVMRGLRRIASTGRAVCATIHQPSVSIFNDFDSLLLLKRGGEVVYHGELGHESRCLIQYFERFESTPRIQPGENPATWMLTTIGAGSSSSKKQFDYAGSYEASKLHAQCLATIDSITASANQDNLISFESLFATSRRTQVWSVLARAMKVYYRSPSYNLVRSVLSSVLALLYATVYVSQRVPKNESDMNSRINSVFMAVLFLCVSAQNTVLGVFEVEVRRRPVVCSYRYHCNFSNA